MLHVSQHISMLPVSVLLFWLLLLLMMLMLMLHSCKVSGIWREASKNLDWRPKREFSPITISTRNTRAGALVTWHHNRAIPHSAPTPLELTSPFIAEWGGGGGGVKAPQLPFISYPIQSTSQAKFKTVKKLIKQQKQLTHVQTANPEEERGSVR